jgi:hypothetical protein
MAVRGPALIVLGIAVFIVVVGGVASALVTGSSPTLSLSTITIPDGTVVHLTPATTAMKGIVNAGQPPADILNNLAVPAGSPIVRTLDIDGNSEQFDRTVYFTSGLSSVQIYEFFRVLLPRLGWDLIYQGSGASRDGADTDVLAKKGSGDGYYWEAGAVVSPTTSAGVTPFSIELYEIPDDN